MSALFHITLKEIKDNLRDRRSFFFAVIYGPIMMPLLMFIPVILGVKSTWIDLDSTTELQVVGAELAPNLIQYLRNHNFDAVAASNNFKQLIREREITIVLEVTAEYGEKLRDAKRAPLLLHFNESSKKSQSAAGHLRSVINSYNSQLGYLRLLSRGIDPEINNVIDLRENDLSKEGISGLILVFFVYFIIVFSMMSGGFYLAVDVTAGERERNSLEPLLSLPVSRQKILLGKWLAVLLFVMFSGFLSVVCIYLILSFFPAGAAGELFSLNRMALLKSLLLTLPCGLLISAILVAIAAFTRSSKEAQTYISLMYLLPAAPSILGQFLDLKPNLLMQIVPFFSQYQLINKVMKDETVAQMPIILSVVGSLLFALSTLMIAIWLYRRDQILMK
ncbi:MAG: ABC transporter permease [Cellvibrionaceae bacterium]|nr:ABC transporter permease [Cellvibrionaceae bacterium]